MFKVWLLIFISSLLVVLAMITNMPKKEYVGRFRPLQLLAFSVGIFLWAFAFSTVFPRGQQAFLGSSVVVLILLSQVVLSGRYLLKMKGHRLYVLAIGMVAAAASLLVTVFSLMGITDDWL